MRHHALLGSAIAGLVHGATNLGGAPLLMLVSGLYRTKHAVRANIAFAYAVMGVMQLIVVALLHDQMFGIHTVMLALIGVATYLSLGQHLFRRLNEVHFRHLMTLGIIIYGVVLLVTSLNMAG
jgi:uncharacterized protein